MFKDVKGGFVNPAREMLSVLGIGANFHRVSCGVYDDCGFNFSNLIDMRSWEDYVEHAGVPCYGVADSIEQFLEVHGAKMMLDPRGCSVGFTTVRRSEQSPDGGWRWHKWGEYIGKHSPQYEYLYDEKEIDSVVTFHVLWEKT